MFKDGFAALHKELEIPLGFSSLSLLYMLSACRFEQGDMLAWIRFLVFLKLL